MNFQPELADKVMAGRKTITRRLASENPRSPWFKDRCAFRVGQRFAVCPGRGKVNIGHATVRSVRLERLGHIPNHEAVREGFRSTQEFERAFTSINGSYDPDVLVWRIVFIVPASA